MTATTLVESLSRLYEHGRLTKAGIAARVKKGTITGKGAINNLSLIHISEPTRPY